MALTDADVAKILAALVPVLGYKDGNGVYHPGLIEDCLADKFSGCVNGTKVPNQLIFDLRTTYGRGC